MYSIRFIYSKVEATIKSTILEIRRLNYEKSAESLLASYNKKIVMFIKRTFKRILVYGPKDLKIMNLGGLFLAWNKDIFFKFKTVVSNTSLNLWLVLGIVLCLMAPILIYSISGFNLYDTSSIQDSFSYSECCAADVAGAPGIHLVQIRICLATILYNLIVLFCFFNYNKLSGYLPNKAVMAATCVIVRGGFEGLGEPGLDAQHETHNATHRLNRSLTQTEAERDSLSMSATQMEYNRQRENSKGTLPSVGYAYPDSPAVPIPIQKGINNTRPRWFLDGHSLTGLGGACPWVNNPSPPLAMPGTPNFPVSLSSVEIVSEHSSVPRGVSSLAAEPTIKKVRFKDVVVLVEIDKDKPILEKNNNIFCKSAKSAISDASPDIISHGQGQINNPSSKRDLTSHLKDLLKK